MGRDSDKPVFVRLRVSSEKRDRFKIACIRLKTDMDEVLNDLLDKWLAENDPEQKKSSGK